ncbi:voltage-gated hydrogen channel 1 [Lepisosteus oculatus]|uniref:voltage-gated hydrogen channel 1 n=1 Tax=Lepisosteus oculatus TaxID=7918 RepID=UPI0035F5090F
MSRYLRHFTVVGDDQDRLARLHEEEHLEASAELEPERPVEHALTFRQSLQRLFASNKFQISVVCLVILDAVFVLCELLLDLAIIKADSEKIAPKVFHYLSLALLTFFMVELLGKLFAYQLEFFKHKFEVFDGIVVIVSFILDIVYISHEDAFDGVGLLILLRLWRVARIINGVLVSVKTRANYKLEKLKTANEHLTQQVNDLQQRKAHMEDENNRLRRLLQQHGIKY